MNLDRPPQLPIVDRASHPLGWLTRATRQSRRKKSGAPGKDSRTRYARNGDVHIAYQVIGDGPIDVVLVQGWITHLEVAWEQPRLADAFRRWASFSRLILIDKRGTGLSDPVNLAALPAITDRMDDILAVLDAVGSKRATLCGISEGGALCMAFAATHPDRTAALVLYGSWARALRADDYAWGFEPRTVERRLAQIRSRWGEGLAVDLIAPALAEDETFRRWWGRYERFAASPSTAFALSRMVFDTDVREILPGIDAATLILHRMEDSFVDVRHSRYMAEHIPNARLVELEGEDHSLLAGDSESFYAEVQEFLTGTRPRPSSERVLTTILFTDIVASTERAVVLGDRLWHELLSGYYHLIRTHLAHYGGREIGTAGDSLVASFDAPAHAIRCAQAIGESVGTLGLAVRTGLHTGEMERIGDGLSGVALHIAARVAALAKPGEVLVSSTVKDLVVGSDLSFREGGNHRLKGVPGGWRLFVLED